MKRTLAGLLTEYYPPEKPKFRAPLLLVHGLWAGSWCWQTWATHFCNLGWDCWAINFSGRSRVAADTSLHSFTLASATEDLKRAVDSLSSLASPPVVLAHSGGSLAALKAAAEEATMSALVLASPVCSRNAQVPRSRALRLLHLKYLPLMLLRRPFRIEERDLRKFFLPPLAESVQAEILRGIVAESSQFAGEFFKPGLDIEPERIFCPRLIVAGTEDQITPRFTTRNIARWLNADFKEYPNQGHWIIEANAESIVRDIHRWLVQRLGDRVLIAELC
jgi:pimeloyl-ACP methyl ester carboxylesterase